MKNQFAALKRMLAAPLAAGKTAWCIWGGYVLAVLVLTALHEPWRDELQFWLIARDLDLTGIIRHMRYEGHFVWWIWLLVPFAKLGLPVISMNLLSAALLIGAGWLWLFRSPFPRWFQVFFLFSYPILYYFSAVARCYALIVPVLWLLAVYYPERCRRPLFYTLLIVALVHTHAYMEGLAGILFVFFFYDAVLADWRGKTRRQKWSGTLVLLLAVLGVAAALLQVLPAFGSTPVAAVSDPRTLSLKDSWNDYMLQMFPMRVMSGHFRHFWLSFYKIIWAAVLFYIFLRSRRLGVIAAVGVGWIWLFHMFLYPIALQRTFLPGLMIVFVWWLGCLLPSPKQKFSGWLLLSLLILPWYFLHQVTWRDVRGLYSPLRLCSQFIASASGPGVCFVANPKSYAGMLSAYAPAAAIYDFEGNKISYFVYGNRPPLQTVVPEDIFRQLDCKVFYLILRDFETPPPGNWSRRLIYSAPRRAVWSDEIFDVYEIRLDSDEH